MTRFVPGRVCVCPELLRGKLQQKMAALSWTWSISNILMGYDAIMKTRPVFITESAVSLLYLSVSAQGPSGAHFRSQDFQKDYAGIRPFSFCALSLLFWRPVCALTQARNLRLRCSRRNCLFHSSRDVLRSSRGRIHS